MLCSQIPKAGYWNHWKAAKKEAIIQFIWFHQKAKGMFGLEDVHEIESFLYMD